METNDHKEIDTYLKYYSNLSIEYLKENGISVRFSPPWVLNDPLEFNPIIKVNQPNEYKRYILDGVTFPSLNEWLRIQTVENKINDFGVLSLTKNLYSFDMWNYYANGHKGFIVEFKQNFNEFELLKSNDGKQYPIKKVTYVDTFAIDISMLSNNEGVFWDKDFNEYLFYTKTNRWEKEEEYRLVKSLSDFGKPYKSNINYRHDGLHLVILPYRYIESITFGSNMSNTNKLEIIDLLKDTDIKFNQAFIIRDEKGVDDNWGKVAIEPVDDSQIQKLLDLVPQAFSYDKASIKYADEEEIQNINELPYYNDTYKKFVDLYFKKNLEIKNRI